MSIPEKHRAIAHAWDTSANWAVSFYLGSATNFDAYDDACVRAVREGAAQ